MVNLVDDQQTEPIEASMRHRGRVVGDHGQIAHRPLATADDAHFL
jgi:hypothetical protein